MPDKLDFSKSFGSSRNIGSSNRSGLIGFIPVRVKQVNIKPSEDKRSLFRIAGGYWGIGAISFESLKQSSSTSQFPKGSIALPLNNNVRTLPLINEIVYVILGPSFSRVIAGNPNANVFYYTNSIPVWNSTELNALPSPVSSGDSSTNSNTKEDIQSGIPNNPDNPKTEPKLGDTFKDQGKIKNLYPQEGDVIFEGRFGNSLRFGSTGVIQGSFDEFSVSPKNPWSKSGPAATLLW